jgi:hypothetical protein
MTSITYDELEKHIASDTEKINEICLHITASYIGVIISITKLNYTSLRLAMRVRNIEKFCTIHAYEGCKDCDVKDLLRTAADNLSECVDRIVKSKIIPTPFVSLIRYSADFLDNKTENLWLVSDPELKTMAAQLADKMHR